MVLAANNPITPNEQDFTAAYARGKSQLVWASVPADMDTPVSAMLRLMQEGEPCFLLESVEKGEIRGRYSIIGLQPDLLWRCEGAKAEVSRGDNLGKGIFTPCAQDSLSAFRALFEESKLDIPDGLPPMSAGLVGYMAYDMVRLMEKLSAAPPDSIHIPDSVFMRTRITVIFDSVTDLLYVITPIWASETKASAAEAYANACARLQKIVATLATPYQPAPAPAKAQPVRIADFTSNTPRERYDASIAKAKDYIAAGDIFQVVLSQRFSAPFTLPPFSLYRALRHLNPSPFLFYLNFCGFQLVGSSPEILVRLRDGEVTIRPIAGTRKRGRNRQEDRELAEDLLCDPKEIAEHLMLLDLGRNDVGRVAKIGSVRTTQRMTIENYSHVMHIVSNVVGELDDKQYDAVSALIAGFPAGTVSGAPKVRAMEIIDELEVNRRSFYAGCVGYFSASGSMDTCIALRTGLVKDGMLHVQAGGGVVADSTAEGEYQESLNKAKALMRAAEEAVKFA